MLVVFSLLLILGLGHCQDNDLPSSHEIESSINRTIEEVERQIREDPRLPQLSRQDIVKFLHNITSQDANSFKDKQKVDRTRKLYQRALMVVLPYNAETSGNLKDLYTKPPMTQIVPDSEKKSNEKQTNFEISTPSAEENLVTDVSHETTLEDLDFSMKNYYKNHRETYSDVQTKIPSKETVKLDSTPVRFSFNLENLQKGTPTSEKSTTTRYPIYSNNEKPSEIEIVYSTSVTEEPTTKPASREITIDLERPKNKENVLSANQWRYNAPPSSNLKPTMPAKLNQVPFLPTINAEPEDKPGVSSTKHPETSSEAFVMSTARPAPIFVTPMPTGTSPKAKFSSTYSLNASGFRSATTTSTSAPMRPEVMDLLASIGLKPENSTNVEDVYEKSKVQAPDTNNFIRTTISGLTSVGPNSPSIVGQNTFESPGSEIKKGVENLTPDVQLLFQRFGLQTSKLGQSATTTTQRTTINLSSYTNFKPLPTSSVKDQEMKEFLARFGLGVSENRKQKSLRTTTQPPSLIEAVPGSMRNILENIGLISKPRKLEDPAPTIPDDMESTETSKFHVFKPHEVNFEDELQKNKINELLDTVKLVHEGKADIQKVKKVTNDLLENTKTLKDGPDPLKLEEIIKIYNEDVRNEVKRQQDQAERTTTPGTNLQTTMASMATTESAETTLSTTSDSLKEASDQEGRLTTLKPEVSTSTAASSGTNLMALEESFGGTTKEPDPVLPQRRKSGLYFLVDWNTFLEVGDDEKEKVNLRFQPKVGDRTRFLSVTVP